MVASKIALALGWKDPEGLPRVLYYGDYPEEGQAALDAAIEKGSIVCGKVVRYWDYFTFVAKERSQEVSA